MKSLDFTLTWFATTFFTLIFALLMLINISSPRIVATPNGPHYQMYKALPSFFSNNPQQVSISKEDGRALIIQRFFAEHKSPLTSLANLFVEVADKNKLDYRFLPALAVDESAGNKSVVKKSNNPFMYKIDGKIAKFSSFEEAIQVIGTEFTQNNLKTEANLPLSVSAYMEQLL